MYVHLKMSGDIFSGEGENVKQVCFLYAAAYIFHTETITGCTDNSRFLNFPVRFASIICVRISIFFPLCPISAPSSFRDSHMLFTLESSI